MTEHETTSRQERLTLFRLLQDKEIILYMNIQGTDFKKLTVVNQVGASENRLRFVVDCPEGYQEAVVGLRNKLFHFSFIGGDGIPRRFTTTGGKIVNENKILFEIPGVVEQRHRRKHFRIPTPAGSFLTALVEDSQERLDIIDISQGGALVTAGGENSKQQKFETGREFTDIRLTLLTGGSKEQPVLVDRAEIMRVAFDKNTESYFYGLMFKEIAPAELLRLKDRIYVNQRQMLRKRKQTTGRHSGTKEKPT